MPRGRPERSVIRDNIISLLYYLNIGYGYDLAKIYNEIFPEVTQRSIYYHLKKGVETKEISIHKVEQEKGNFSWGNMVEKTYYALGENAQPKIDERIASYLTQKNEIKLLFKGL